MLKYRRTAGWFRTTAMVVTSVTADALARSKLQRWSKAESLNIRMLGTTYARTGGE